MTLVPVADQSDRYDESPVDRFRLLDVHSPTGLARPTARVDALATISAGRKGSDGFPEISRDGTIFLHDPDGRAPALRKALDATRGKQLTIAFPMDDPAVFVQQRFTEYTASSLRIYGDDRELHEIVTESSTDKRGRPTSTLKEHLVHEAGSPRFRELLKRCKVSWSIYFVLAHWEGDHSEISFDDGLGLYRLRTTSAHSLANIKAQLHLVSGFTGGHIAGIPFDLRLVYPEVADPTGAKRTVPVWSVTMRPPESVKLTSRTFGPMIRRALAEGDALQVGDRALAAPRPETWETERAEVAEGVVVLDDAPTEEDIAAMLSGAAPADAGYWTARFFAMVRDTPLDSSTARAGLLEGMTGSRTSSLAAFLREATNAEAEQLIGQVARVLDDLTDTTPAEATAERQPGAQAASTAQRHSGAPAGLTSPELAGATPDERRDHEEALPAGPAARVAPQTQAAGAAPSGDGLAQCALCGSVQPCRPVFSAEGDDAFLCVDKAACEQRAKADPESGQQAECAECRTVQRCVSDGETLVCADREACQHRGEAQRAVLGPLGAWLEALRTRMDQHPQADVAASPAARRDAVRVLTQASDDDPAQAERLMRLIFEVESSRDLSHGQCLVLVEEAANPNWKARAAALLEGVPA